WILVTLMWFFILLQISMYAGADDHDPVRPKMDGGTDGRQLSHGTIAEPFPFVGHRQAIGGKDERDGAGSHQMFQTDGLGHSIAATARPRLDRMGRLVESQVIAAGVA